MHGVHTGHSHSTQSWRRKAECDPLGALWRITCTQFSSVQSLSRVRLFGKPWTEALQASLSVTNSRSLPKLMSIKSVMPSNHLIHCRPLLLQPSIFPAPALFSQNFLGIFFHAGLKLGTRGRQNTKTQGKGCFDGAGPLTP